MNNDKYMFKQIEKAQVLQGRTIKYLAENKIGITPTYLSNILNGKIHCSKIVANRITESICREAKLEDYFEVIE